MPKIIFILFALVIIFACSGPVDSIGDANIKTKRVLKTYKQNGDPGAVFSWLFARHGEAPGHQVFISLASWSFRNQESFKKLLKQLPQEHMDEFVWRYAFAVTDSGQSEDFKAAYGKEPDDILIKIGSEIFKNLKLIENHLKNRNS